MHWDDIPQPQAGFIDRIDCFDALFFGITPAEARRIDPQCRLFLETVWAALEDAGTPRSALKKNRTPSYGHRCPEFLSAL